MIQLFACIDGMTVVSDVEDRDLLFTGRSLASLPVNVGSHSWPIFYIPGDLLHFWCPILVYQHFFLGIVVWDCTLVTPGVFTLACSCIHTFMIELVFVFTPWVSMCVFFVVVLAYSLCIGLLCECLVFFHNTDISVYIGVPHLFFCFVLFLDCSSV